MPRSAKPTLISSSTTFSALRRQRSACNLAPLKAQAPAAAAGQRCQRTCNVITTLRLSACPSAVASEAIWSWSP